MANLLPVITITSKLNDTNFDALILVGESQHFQQCPGGVVEDVVNFGNLDASSDVKVIPCKQAAGGRIIHSPTGPVTGDFDDVREFQQAAIKAIKKALSAGVKAPLIVLPSHSVFQNAGKATLLGALFALYTPIEVREHKGDPNFKKMAKLGVFCADAGVCSKVLKEVAALESGRIVARDIGGSDPERMAAPRVAEYVQNIFKDTDVKVNIISDVRVFEEYYPLLAAVNRCSAKIDRHAGRLIKLEYTGEGPVEQTIMLVGKGINYDTGGADIKAGGVMQGMSRDKCGAAAVAGFFQMLSVYKPKGLKVVGAMAMVRNSVGSECYVSDEIILSRAGVRVRVGNTDAEGRMAMTDVLCEMKEKAKDEVKPHLFTIATLTGHVIRCYGANYTSLLDNGPAKKAKISEKVADAGEKSGDPCEVTRLRKEDFEFNRPRNEYEDVVQANNKASTMTNRGHMSPAAFMITASGLDKHGCDSDSPIPYTHMDIAGSCGSFPDVPTGAPIVALAHAFVLDKDSSS